MIKNINFINIALSFNNDKNIFVEIIPSSFGNYSSISSFIEINDGLILVLDWYKKNPSDEERRRNVFKVNENGKLLWIVSDKLEVLQKILPGNKSILESERKKSFTTISFNKDKVILFDGAYFFLNTVTGQLEFWKAEK